MGKKFKFYKMKRVPEMDGRDGCTTLWVYLTPVNCRLRNGFGSGNLKGVVLLQRDNALNFIYFISLMRRKIFPWRGISL